LTLPFYRQSSINFSRNGLQNLQDDVVSVVNPGEDETIANSKEFQDWFVVWRAIP